MSRSRDAAHFQRLYDASPDPWGFRSSEYERAKYRRTIAALEGRRFLSGFEVGCSIGVLTRQLADRCDALLAVDLVETPLLAAETACTDVPWVRFQRMQVPHEWPDATFDLIVLSEVLYFLTPADIAATVDRVEATLAPKGIVLLVNWLGRSGDPCTGDQAATHFIERSRQWLFPQLQWRGHRYRLDLLLREPNLWISRRANC